MPVCTPHFNLPAAFTFSSVEAAWAAVVPANSARPATRYLQYFIEVLSFPAIALLFPSCGRGANFIPIPDINRLDSRSTDGGFFAFRKVSWTGDAPGGARYRKCLRSSGKQPNRVQGVPIRGEDKTLEGCTR